MESEESETKCSGITMASSKNNSVCSDPSLRAGSSRGKKEEKSYARSKSEPPSHGKTEVKMEVTPIDLGPLNFIEGKHESNFLGGHYWVTTPKGECLVLHRLHGGRAGELGQYWTVDKRAGNVMDRMDLAVPYFWNTMEEKTTLIVPKGVLIYEGFAAPQGTLIGGGSQAFIPRTVVKALHHWQTQKHEYIVKGTNQMELLKAEQKWKEAQLDILQRWNRKRLETICSDAHGTAMRGNHFGSLSAPIQSFIRNAKKGKHSMTMDNIRQGTYKVHEERLSFFNGISMKVTLSVKIEFVKSVTRTYKAGKTIIVETTHYYNIIYIWS